MVGITPAAALALLGLASAAPTGQSKSQASNSPSGNTFIASNVPTGNTIVRDGPAALSQALGKYGVSMNTPDTNQGNALGSAASSTVSSAVSAANKVTSGQAASSTLGTGSNAPGQETGSVAATSQQNDLEYTSQIQVGGQTIQVNFDTGSSDLWLFNTKMAANEASGHTLYDPSKSSTFKQMQGSKFAVHYGDGSQVSGSLVGTETVNIGGADVDNQVIELPDIVASSFITDKNSNGLVGLAFNTVNTVTPTRANTFIENVAPQLKQPVFTANLKHAATGAYQFGTIDQSMYTGDMAWVPVDKSKGLWQFTSNFYAVGDKTKAKNNNGASPAIADTGTSLLLMDDVVVHDYYSAIQGATNTTGDGGWVFPCSATPPDLLIGVTGGIGGGAMNTVSGSLMNYTAIGKNNMCFGALQSNAGTGLQILGDPLFKSAFTAFHIGNSSIGFASHAN